MDQTDLGGAAPPITPRLPIAHADALALTAAGIDPELIAERLAVPREALTPLIEIATSKVRSFLAVREAE